MNHEIWDDVWFGDQDQLTLVRKYNDNLFAIAIALDGKTNIDEMVSIHLTNDDIPILIASLQHLLNKDKK
jgi:hypothetical protein